MADQPTRHSSLARWITTASNRVLWMNRGHAKNGCANEQPHTYGFRVGCSSEEFWMKQAIVDTASSPPSADEGVEKPLENFVKKFIPR